MKIIKYITFLIIVVIISGCVSSSAHQLTTDELVYKSTPSTYNVKDIRIYLKEAPGFRISTPLSTFIVTDSVFQDAIKRSMVEYGFNEIYGTTPEYEQGKYDWILSIETDISYDYRSSKLANVIRYSLTTAKTGTKILDKFITTEEEYDYRDYYLTKRKSNGREEVDFFNKLVKVVKDNFALFILSIDELVSEYREVKEEDSRLIITIMDFRSENIAKSEVFLIEDLLGSALIYLKKFKIIERAQRNKMLEEIEFSYKDCTDEKCQIEIGRLIAADNIVIGSRAELANDIY